MTKNLFCKACAMVVALLAAYSAQSASAALVNNNLSGKVEYDGWNSLTASTPGLSTAVLTTAPGFGSNEAGSGNANLLRTSGGHYPAGSSLYSFSTPSTFEVSDTSALSNVGTVVLTINSWRNVISYTVPPTLNYNGGAQALVPTYTGVAEAGMIDFGGPVQTYYDTFQWDLSAIGATITSYDIDWGQQVHAGVIALQLESADVFSQSLATIAVPEPSSCAIVSLLGFAMLAKGRGRRRS